LLESGGFYDSSKFGPLTYDKKFGIESSLCDCARRSYEATPGIHGGFILNRFS